MRRIAVGSKCPSAQCRGWVRFASVRLVWSGLAWFCFVCGACRGRPAELVRGEVDEVVVHYRRTRSDDGLVRRRFKSNMSDVGV